MREIKLSPRAAKLAQVQVWKVRRMPVNLTIRMVGKVEFDESEISSITAWVPGRIEKLFIAFTGAHVRKGAPMVNLYSPQLFSAQQELLQAIRSAKSLRKSGITRMRATADATIAAARSRLRLWGLTPGQLDAIIKRGKPSENTLLLAPISGVVIEKQATEGQYVKTGTKIYTVADLSRVWVKLDAYESYLGWLRLGQTVEFQARAYPGEVFTGTVAFIDPFLTPRTRTAKVRLNVANADGRLKPEMFVRASLKVRLTTQRQALSDPKAGLLPPLVIPKSAPLITGTRAVVYVAVPGKPGVYQGREIVLGPRVGRGYVVRSGLQPGELVVTKGNFKIDSAVQILAKPSMMSPEGGGGASAHDHGEKKPVKKDQPQAMVMQIPKEFKHQLGPIVATLQPLQKELKEGDLTAAKSRFRMLGHKVKQVDATSLQGHPLMQWGEMSMLMKNDAVEGSASPTVAVATRVAHTFERHVARLRQMFQLSGHVR